MGDSQAKVQVNYFLIFIYDWCIYEPRHEKTNKRINGPVNAHLRSAVYTNDIENSPSIGADEPLGPFFFSE